MPRQRVLLDDGKVQLDCRSDPGEDGENKLVCKVIRGGTITSGKGINLPDTNLSTPALTERDRECVQFAVENDIDFLALSFVRRAEDVRGLKDFLCDLGASSSIPVISKIEKPQALEDIEAIRAKVRIESCTGDGRVKIRGDWIYEHESGSRYDFQQAINIYGARGEITAWGDFYVYDTEADIFIDKVSSDNSIDIMGKDFVVTIWFLSDKPKFRVRQLGKIIYEKVLEPLPTERFYVIDVRSWSGEGTCTAYFDNIKVFIDN